MQLGTETGVACHQAAVPPVRLAGCSSVRQGFKEATMKQAVAAAVGQKFEGTLSVLVLAQVLVGDTLTNDSDIARH